MKKVIENTIKHSDQVQKNQPIDFAENPYLKHLRMITMLVDNLILHWEGFVALVPEESLDGVEERNVMRALHKVTKKMWLLGRRFTWLGMPGEPEYRHALAENAQFDDFRDLQYLFAAVRQYEQMMQDSFDRAKANSAKRDCRAAMFPAMPGK